MKDISEGVKIIIAVIVCILLGLWIGLTYDNKELIDTPSNIPPCPDTVNAMYYDFHDERWKYIFSGDRAKGINRTVEPYITKDDLQEHLERNVDDYFEDTYWGEEYDLD